MTSLAWVFDPIQSLDCTNSKGALQVAKLSFWSRKMHNVLKLMQAQFSDFIFILSFNKIFVLSSWDRDISTKNSNNKFKFAPILINIFDAKKTEKKCRQILFEKCISLRFSLILRIIWNVHLFPFAFYQLTIWFQQCL